ncbi:Mth938-like domain-containing protein [Acidovorax sp. FG27]|uniref:Mth938-like domain-containing protein n=1 Tax=Acidovorax sp. FG27 TaxID=3133652 RepID=UPI0030E89C23
MKFQPDRSSSQTISGYGPGWIGVDADRITHSVVLTSGGVRIDWNCARYEDLTPAHFAQLAELDCELVIFGSGGRNRFPPPAWLQPLMARRMGLETMDTQAACRTYNILAGEGRNVAAALLLETAPQAGSASA